MELYNDLIFSGKGLNDIINDDNIYTNQGIIFKSINSNQDLSINADSNYLKFSVKPTSIDINYNKSISFNNILHISSNSNVGIGLINPQNTLDVAGTISCGDININNSIFDKDIIKNIGFSTKDFDKGILNIFNGGTNTNNINEEQLLFGKFEQSPFLIWKNDERRLGIETENPVETLDISGDMNSLYYRINGNDIGNIFVKDFYSSSNDCFKNCSNITFYTSADYTSMISYNLTNIINSRTIDWVKNNEKNHYIQSKVGIGTDIPSYKLDIKGDINYTGELRIKGYLNKVFDGNYAYLNNSPGYTWDISNANLYNLNKGSVGIGTEIPKYTLDVNGSINYRSDIRKNGNIINIFDGNYKNLIDTPTLSKFAYSGSFYDLTELPYIFNGIYSNLNNKPLFFPTNWDSNYILNMPTYFNTNWDTHVMNKPEYFTTNWNKYVKNKPKFFDVDYNINIKNKPLYLPADWNKTIVNKPINYNVDWDSNIYNKPDFSEFAYTGDFKNLLNKPFIFSGLYRELREKPYFSKVAFTGNYNDLLNRPNLFSGEYNELLDTPIYFKSDYNLNIINKPDFPTIAFSGLFKDIVGVSSIKNWGENGTHIYSCNLSNIGIGITNPSFKLDIKGMINLNDGLIFNNINNFEKNNPWGVYFAEDFDGSLLRDSSGNERHATTSTGNITKTSGAGAGALGNINYLTGGISSVVNWPTGSIPVNFTILSLTRYTGGSRKRILTSDFSGGNFLHGHWGYDFNTNEYRGRGCVYYEGWKSRYSSPILGNLDDWLCCIGKNSETTPNNILFDGVPSGTENGGVGGFKLCINDIGENSDWAFGCVIIWDYHLTDEDCLFYNNIIQNYLNLGGSIKKFFKDNGIIINNNCYFKNSNNFNFLTTSNDLYITSNWIVDSNSNLYNLNKGSVGINNINPSTSYKLDVNGIINTSSNLLLTGGFYWSSFNTEIICPSLPINDLVIKTKSDKKLILTNGNNNEVLFLNSRNIGIGTTNPSSIIHLHNISNQEVKLSLSSVFSIAKNTDNDGIIWNSNKGISFGTNKIERLSLINIEKRDPWGIYFAGNYSNNTLYDLSGNGRHAITTGTIISNNSSDVFGARGIIKSISGGISSTISWPTGSIPENFTILSLTRYTNTNNNTNRGRILQGQIRNFLHGHHNNRRGLCHYDGWKTIEKSIGNINDWLCCIGRNGGTTPKNIIVDYSEIGYEIGGYGNDDLRINLGAHPDEKSDWALSYVVIWNRHLTDDEMFSNNLLLINYLLTGSEPSFISENRGSKIEINNNSINLNNAFNQKVEINLTDSSSSTLGFSIYKSINNDGNLFNNKNNNLIFGTNNTEKLRITNYGNVGIGITIPSSAIHLHNILSNQEVKLSLSSVFSIAKNAINDGIIWNSNKGISFGTNNIERLSLNNIEKREPVGIYFAGNYSNNTLYDLSGNGRHAITTGAITSNLSNGNGATSNIRSISGGTSATITWPAGSIPNNFTILSLTRYTGGNRGRILQSSDENWIHGHHGGNRGVCYYNGWKTTYPLTETLDNWLCCIGKNSSTTPYNIFVDGKAVGKYSGGDGNKTLVIKNTGEISDWALSYVIIWNRHLTDDEMFSNSKLITNYLSSGTEPSFISANGGSKIEINNNSINLHNLLNQKVEINLTDSSSTLGFSIYKSSNNDGNLFNNKNNNLIFGTNNTEKLRITNYGNVGIGITIPSSAIHLHNILSNQEVKLSLSSVFSIAKNAINDGIIWNSNKGISFGTNNIERLSLNNIEKREPVGIYFAGNYSNNTLYDLSGNGRHAITTGAITSNLSNGNGATSNIRSISGGTSATITWPAGSIPNNFTILSLTRYTGASKGRILHDNGGWIHGHHGGFRGVCYYNGWKTIQESIGTLENWLCCIGKNSSTTPNNILIDGRSKGNLSGGDGNKTLVINIGGETSDWALSWIIIWNRHLTDDEMFSNSSLLTNYLSGTWPSFVSPNRGCKIEINNNSINLHNISSNQKVEINLTDSSSTLGFSIYKSSNNDGNLFNVANSNLIFGTNNIERLRITNSGNVGIGTTNPTNILDVNGTIQGNFRGNGANLNNLDFVKFTNGLLPVANGGTGLSNISNNFLLIGNGTTAITQISNLIWINDNLGVNNTNPQHKLDVNGTINANFLRGSGSNISNLDLTKFSSGLLSINCGGLGTSTLISNQILIGNGTGAITQTTNLFWNNRLGIKNSAPTCALDVSGDIKATSFYGNGSNLTNLNPNNINITIPVNRGGTGQLTLTSNYILIGNGTNSITQSINLFWNNTSSNLGINKSNPEYNLDIDGILKSSSNISTINGSNITNLNVSNISSGTLPVASGGIGTSTLISNQILIGNGTGAITQTTNLTWDNTNNRLGINKSVPTTTLDIVGNINFTGNLRQNGEIYSGVGKRFYWTSSPSFFSTTELTYRNSGSVGIGTHIIDKTYLLHVNGNIKCSKLITSINKYGITSDNHGVFSPNVLIINNRYISESSKILFNLDTKIDLNDNNIQFETKLLSDISSNGFYFNNGNVGISTNSSRYRLSVYNANTSFNKNLSYYNVDISSKTNINIYYNIYYSPTIINNSTYYSAYYKNNGTIRFDYDVIADVLLYGGGGSGGGVNDSLNIKNPINGFYYAAGGGGGGGVGFGTIKFKKDTIYNINIGNGGNNVSRGMGEKGGDTSIIGDDINEIAYGGGGGAIGILYEKIYLETLIINSSQKITFSTNRVCEVLIVGGGGGGGYNSGLEGGGGGGAGGVGFGTIKFKKNTEYTIIIGNGGNGATQHGNGTNGENTSIFGNDEINEIAYGGGGGGGGREGNNGGCGGGGSGNGGNKNGGEATRGISFSTSSANVNYFGREGGLGRQNQGGGGGGSGGIYGINSTTGYGGDGGRGYQYNYPGLINFYAGGGGGGATQNISDKKGSGGFYGGGGDGGDSTNNNTATNGINNKGGGGGGGRANNSGGNGGSGIVILRHFLIGGEDGGSGGGDGGISTKGLSSSGINANIIYYGNNGGLISESGSIGGGGGGGGGNSLNANGGSSYISYLLDTPINICGGGGGSSGKYSNSTQIAVGYGIGGNNSGGNGSYGMTINGFDGYNGGGGGGGGSFTSSGRGGDGGVIIKIDYTKQEKKITYYENTNISNISAEFRNTIQVKGDIVGSSDNRIKKDIFDINSKNALDLISRINPKSFNYIDNIDKGFKNNYGFIAQDIIKNIPDAVRFTKDIIPNIMKKYRINNDIIETNEDLTSKLYINDNIEIIDKDNNRNKYKILDISSNYIKIDKSIEDNYGFIYGKEVEDFHILDKKIIFTLNVSATQELNKRIKKQQRKLLKQEMKLIKQEKIIKEQELKFEEQEKQLKYLFINYY